MANKISKEKQVISMSKMTKERILIVSNQIKDKVLFADKIEIVKKTLREIKSLPI